MATTNSTTSAYSYLSTSGSRFSGLASGMDIDSIVEKLMKAESAKKEKLQQQKQKLEWQRESYRSVNVKLESFRSELFDKYKPSSFSTKSTTVSDSSKVSATATSSASGTLQLNSVTSLAKAASKSQSINSVSTLNASHRLSDLGVNSSGTAKFTINGEEKELVYNASDSLGSITQKLKNLGLSDALFNNGQFSLGADVQVTSDNESFLQKLGFNKSVGDTITSTEVSTNSTSNYVVNGSSTLSQLGLNLNGQEKGTITFNVLQKDGSMKVTAIDYKETDTIDQLVSKINNSADGITALFSNGQLSLSTSSTGNAEGGSLQVLSDTGNNLLSSIGFSNATGEIANGENAVYKVNGITKTSQTNSFTELGYNVTLNKTFAESEGTVSVSSATDTQKIVDQVKSFVDLYNGLIESLNKQTKEKKDYNYAPLTDAQKSEMSEDEIKKWEEKAKQGLLRNDSAITKVVSEMRSSIYSITTNLDSKYNTLFNIGITTSNTYSDGGKLVIDEDKLKEAIEANPEAVSDLFTRSTGVNGTTDKGGLVTQLRAIAKTGVDSISSKAGKEGSAENTYTLGKDIATLNQKIADWVERLKNTENRYFKQFSAMETAIQKANSQSSLFMS